MQCCRSRPLGAGGVREVLPTPLLQPGGWLAWCSEAALAVGRCSPAGPCSSYSPPRAAPASAGSSSATYIHQEGAEA